MPPITSIENVVTNVVYEGPLRERLCKVFDTARITQIAPGEPQQLKQALDQADIAVLSELLPASQITGSRLKWVHITHAGLDKVARPEILERGIRLSGSAGYSVEALAEHVLFFMLSLAYRSRDLFESQRKSAWEKAGREHLRSLYKQTVGIIGMGHIGKALATRCHAMGMQVLAYRRSDEPMPPGVHKVFCEENGDQPVSLLAQADYVVLAVPLTNQSHKMIAATELAQMKPSAHLINIARGNVVDEQALIHALETGQIAGAGLDVFAVEPLPSDSPLWQMPNVIVTPHTSAREPDRDDRAVDLIAENYRRFLSGEPLINELTTENLYTF